jgi:hypothetical protein
MAQSNEPGKKESGLIILANIIAFYMDFFRENENNFSAMLHIIKESLTARQPKV